MSVHNRTEQDQVLQAAAWWRARLSADDVTEADFLAFEEWIAIADHKAAFDRLEDNLLVVESFADDLRAHLREGAPGPGGANVVAITRRRRPAIMALVGGLAAAALAVVLVGVGQLSPTGPQPETYMATANASRTVLLADGSLIELNRGSSVRVAFEKELRKVILEKGEAIFNVRHDAARPFAVLAGDTEVRDIGTEFNVVFSPARTVVTVREGEVRILDQRISAHQDLTPGMQIAIEQQSGDVVVSEVEPDDVFAWREGRLVFRNTRLKDVLADLSRYSERPFLLDDPGLAERHFSGVIQIDSTDGMSRHLEDLMDITVEQKPDAILVRSRK